MIAIRIPTRDDRWLILPRYSPPSKELMLLMEQIGGVMAARPVLSIAARAAMKSSMQRPWLYSRLVDGMKSSWCVALRPRWRRALPMLRFLENICEAVSLKQGRRENGVLKEHRRRPNVPHRQVGQSRIASSRLGSPPGRAFLLLGANTLETRDSANVLDRKLPVRRPVSAHTRPGWRCAPPGRAQVPRRRLRARSPDYLKCGSACLDIPTPRIPIDMQTAREYTRNRGVTEPNRYWTAAGINRQPSCNQTRCFLLSD
jgi:hypothetical protein